MGDVLQLKPCTNVALALRNIADGIESGELEINEMTLIAPPDVFHLGEFHADRAAANAVFNMQYGLYKLVGAAIIHE